MICYNRQWNCRLTSSWTLCLTACSAFRATASPTLMHRSFRCQNFCWRESCAVGASSTSFSSKVLEISYDIREYYTFPQKKHIRLCFLVYWRQTHHAFLKYLFYQWSKSILYIYWLDSLSQTISQHTNTIIWQLLGS